MNTESAAFMDQVPTKDSQPVQSKDSKGSSQTRWTMMRFGFRLEPIVELSTGGHIGAEVLRDGGHFPLKALWRAWYSRIGSIQTQAPGIGLFFVNVHTDQVCDRTLMERLLAGTPELSRLVLEWTELPSSRSALIEAAAILKDYRGQFGIHLCVDDFGSGADGVQRLGLVAPDIVKIDGPCLHAARETGHARTLLKNMVHLIEDTGASAVIEWIESKQDLEIATEAGANWGQGFYWPHEAGLI